MVIDLRKPKLFKAKVDTIVITSRGCKFTKQKNSSWKDNLSGLVWHNIEAKTYTYDEALTTFGNRLPTRDEIDTGIEHGMLEVIYNPEKSFWSASVFSYDREFAWIFNGGYGYVYLDYRDLGFAVRCVGR
jgi:hypothetical protein